MIKTVGIYYLKSFLGYFKMDCLKASENVNFFLVSPFTTVWLPVISNVHFDIEILNKLPSVGCCPTAFIMNDRTLNDEKQTESRYFY